MLLSNHVGHWYYYTHVWWQTKEQQYVRSTSGGGVGSVSVHPTKQYFAMAEKGSAPNINILDYPNLKLYRILRGGTERAYAYCDFR